MQLRTFCCQVLVSMSKCGFALQFPDFRMQTSVTFLEFRPVKKLARMEVVLPQLDYDKEAKDHKSMDEWRIDYSERMQAILDSSSVWVSEITKGSVKFAVVGDEAVLQRLTKLQFFLGSSVKVIPVEFKTQQVIASPLCDII